jgi:uncharacterized membrane protein YfcA
MHVLFYLLLGLVIGGIGGMVGIGGGVLLIPALTALFRMEPRQAAGVTLAVLAVPVTLPAVVQYYSQGHVRREDLVVAGWIALAFAVGTFFGARLQKHLDVGQLRLFFGLIMLYTGVRLIVHSDFDAVSAAAGLIATGFAWLGFLGLRALGRRHISRPSLAAQIQREAAGSSANPIDYYI